MTQIITASPFRCRMWDFHDRLEHLLSEETCRTEIKSFAAHGQWVPALGRPLRGDPDHDVELIYGARRLFVARHLNMPLAVELRDMTDREAIAAVDVENRQRVDVSPYERGLFFARCLRAGHFKSQDQLATALNISQSQVSRLLKLAQLPSVIVNAFENPLEIREGWGLDLNETLQDPQRRKRAIGLARTLSGMSPRLPAVEAYQQLMSAAPAGRRTRSTRHDEVVTDVDGSPLFRIRRQTKNIALLLPLDKTSAETLDSVRDAVRGALRQKSPKRAIGRVTTDFTPSALHAAAARG